MMGGLARQQSHANGLGSPHQRQLSIKPGDFVIGPDGTIPQARGMTRGKSFSNMNRQPSMSNLKKRQSSRKLLDIQDSSAMIAEIRSVAVLFIKVDIPNMDLLVDSSLKRPVRGGMRGSIRGSMQASMKYTPGAELVTFKSVRDLTAGSEFISSLLANCAVLLTCHLTR